MKRKVKIAAAGAAVLAFVGVGAAMVYVSLFESKHLKYRDQAALLAAMPGTATGELTARGLRLAGPLGCWSMPEAAPKKLRVECSGETPQGRRVQIIGAAEEAAKTQFFTVLLDGHPTEQNVGCLGDDCRPHHG